MRQRTQSAVLIALALVTAAWSPLPAKAHDGQLHHVNDQMRQAAEEFLSALTPELQAQVRFPFDGVQRTNWHYVPMERVGVPFKAMSLEQRRAARKLMRSVLSDKGYLKATTIMSLEQVLRAMEAGRDGVDSIRDPEKYWFALFGDPAGDEPWGWRVEGHHLSLNFTSEDGVVASFAPLFLGANPAEVRVGPRSGLRALGSEEDAARELMASFTDQQRERVLITEEAPREVLTVPGAPIDLGAPAGLALREMTAEQQQLLKALVR
ncbi:MAG: DUF3500 domain-containing protein, partial [Planctomycetales bacterium]|nr:DUF3500 domain-containing protein [Planctomycetales bacterium]